ncbi:hypothetical protein LINPERPRIM_LOCUS15352, partial [Linum perenne]
NYSVPSSVGLLNSSKCQFQEFEEGINRLRTQMEDAHKQLRILEGNVSQISTLYEADYHQQILHQILKRVLMQKQVLEEKLASRSSSQAAGASNSKGLISVTQQAAAPPNLMDWIPPPQQQQLQVLNFLDSTALLDHTLHAAHQHQVYYSSLGHTSENDNHRDDWPHVADVNLDHLVGAESSTGEMPRHDGTWEELLHVQHG